MISSPPYISKKWHQINASVSLVFPSRAIWYGADVLEDTDNGAWEAPGRDPRARQQTIRPPADVVRYLGSYTFYLIAPLRQRDRIPRYCGKTVRSSMATDKIPHETVAGLDLSM